MGSSSLLLDDLTARAWSSDAAGRRFDREFRGERSGRDYRPGRTCRPALVCRRGHDLTVLLAGAAPRAIVRPPDRAVIVRR